MKEKPKLKGENVIYLLVSVFGLGCLLSVAGAENLHMSSGIGMGATLYSDTLSILLLLASIAGILKVVFVQDKTDAEKPLVTRQALIIAGCAVVYVIGITQIGFYISSAICLFVIHMNYESWAKDKIVKGVFFSLILCAVFYGAFEAMDIYLPNTILF